MNSFVQVSIPWFYNIPVYSLYHFVSVSILARSILVIADPKIVNNIKNINQYLIIFDCSIY